MQRFSTYSKYRFCQAVFAIGFVTTLFWLAHMSPFASQHHNKLAYAGVAIAVLVTIPFALGFYYYRAKIRNGEVDAVPVETLARAARMADEPKRSVRKERA